MSEPVVLADGKVTKTILVEGSGRNPPHNSDVTVHYTGRLLDGTKFDSSLDRADPFKFKLGAGQVIKGWDVGVASMKKGEKSLLRIASDYAYGKSGSPPKIPGNADLEFEVELLDFDLTQKVTEDGQIKKRIITEGNGNFRPNDGATVTVTYSASVKGADKPYLVVNEPTTFVLGSDVNALTGLEESIKNMYNEEESLFIIAPGYAYGERGNPNYNIPPFSTLEITIKLIKFTKGKETFEMDNKEKIALMLKHKEFGNHFFKQGDNPKAIQKWQKAIKLVQYDNHWTDEEKKERNAILVTCHSNLATLWAKGFEWDKVLTDTSEALKIDPNHVKCLYRQGQALFKTEKLSEAENILSKALQIDPSNKEIQKEFSNVKAKIKSIKDKEKAAFGGWFNKISLVSDKEIQEQKLRDEQQKKRETKQSDNNDMSEDDDSPPALEDNEEDGASAHGGHGGHGHSHGGQPCHGHGEPAAAAVKQDDHGHSHSGDDHGHSHSGDDHGHSHAGDDHGHSHSGNNHGHSHGSESHGHSH